jgi:DNA-binding transcriptional LysR family regulator
MPRAVEDLANHDCLVTVRANGMREPWPLEEGGAFVPARPRLLANASSLLRIGALEGVGIAFMAHSVVSADVQSGALVRVLERRVGQLVAVSLVYPASARMSPKLRCFVDFTQSWVERLAGPPPSSAHGRTASS